MRSAVDKCKVGGTIVYSTCSFAIEENEGVIDYILKARDVKLVDTGVKLENRVFLGFNGHQYSDQIKKCVRVMPHVHNLDGFFIAKLIKLKDHKPKGNQDKEKGHKEIPIIKSNKKIQKDKKDPKETPSPKKAKDSENSKVNSSKKVNRPKPDKKDQTETTPAKVSSSQIEQ